MKDANVSIETGPFCKSWRSNLGLRRGCIERYGAGPESGVPPANCRVRALTAHPVTAAAQEAPKHPVFEGRCVTWDVGHRHGRAPLREIFHGIYPPSGARPYQTAVSVMWGPAGRPLWRVQKAGHPTGEHRCNTFFILITSKAVHAPTRQPLALCRSCPSVFWRVREAGHPPARAAAVCFSSS